MLRGNKNLRADFRLIDGRPSMKTGSLELVNVYALYRNLPSVIDGPTMARQTRQDSLLTEYMHKQIDLSRIQCL